MDTQTTTTDTFTTTTRLATVMAIGHKQRHGHELAGFYVTRDGISTLERTCCGEWA